MKELTVYCTHHNEYGVCTQEDWDDAQLGRNPSGQVRVRFATFSQAVPKTYLRKTEGVDVLQWGYQELTLQLGAHDGMRA